MTDIYGQRSKSLLTSADLQSSLENKLRRHLDGLGSPLYALKWKKWDMPSGLPICALRASGRRTSANVCTGALYDNKGNYLGQIPIEQLQMLRDDGRSNQHGKNARPLNEVAMLAGWGTPNSAAPGGTPEQALKRKEKHPCGQSVTILDHQVQLTEIPGPMSSISHAPTEKHGQLNPAFSRWLMGFPAEWGTCADTETRSSRR